MDVVVHQRQRVQAGAQLLSAHATIVVLPVSSRCTCTLRRSARGGTSTLTGMAQPSDLETRVAALETQVAALTERVRHSERDAAAARVLAGGADRDVSELRGEIREFRDQNSRVFNAMRDDLGDLRSRMDSGFIEMRGKFDVTAAGLDRITGMLTTLLEQRDEQYVGSTRPLAPMTRVGEWNIQDAVRIYLTATDLRRSIVTAPLPGTTAGAFRAGRNLELTYHRKQRN